MTFIDRISPAVCVVAVAFESGLALAQQPADPFVTPYTESCSVCHGASLEGAAQGPPLVGVDLKHGDSVDEIAKSIAAGVPDTAMPAWSATLDDVQIRRLAIFISERRHDLTYTDFKIGSAPAAPQGTIESEEHAFRIETVATGLDPLPYSIAPLPDGRILLTEKTRGLSIISPSGLRRCAPASRRAGSRNSSRWTIVSKLQAAP